MAGRKFDSDTGLVFDDGSVPSPDALHLYYPESIRGIQPQLAELISERIQKPHWFNEVVPTIVEQIIGFFDVIHTMHERAQSVLEDYSQNKHPYCLYLRRFSAAGFRGEVLPGRSGTTQTLAMRRGDLEFREYLSDQLRKLLPVVSCLNTLDMFTVATVRHSTKEKPAVLRLLSHTWKPTVAALIDNARMIILHISPTRDSDATVATAGVSTEMGYLYSLRQTQRCLLVIDADRPVPRHGTFDFRAAFGWPAAKAELSAELRTLATDDFRRQSMQIGFPDLSCFVIDRNIEPAFEQFRNDDLSAVRYTYFIPRSLEPNVNLFNAEYPRMISLWTAIEERLRASHRVETNEILHVLFIALTCFVLATTLEYYEPMARSIATVGLAYSIVTKDGTFHRVCLSGAMKFARLGRVDDLAEYFAKASSDLPAESG